MTQVSKINGIPIVNTVVSGFTYDGVNTLTIQETDGTTFNVVISNLTLTDLRSTNIYGDVFSGNTTEAVFYGDGSNLTGIVGSTDNYVTGATMVGNTLVLNRTDQLSAATVDLSQFLDNTNYYVTGGTLTNNSVVIGRNDGQQPLTISGGTNVTITEPINGIFKFDSPDTGGSSLTGDTVVLDFTLDGTYTTSSSTFANVPINIIIQSATTYNSDFSTMSGVLICDISLSDSGVAGEFDLYNLTDGTSVSGSVTAFTDADGLKSSNSFSLTNIHFDDTFVVRVRRTGNPASSDMRIRAAQLKLILT